MMQSPTFNCSVAKPYTFLVEHLAESNTNEVEY